MLMLLFHFNCTRSGEWGDHVTLQAAADSVWFLTIIFSLFELSQILISLIVDECLEVPSLFGVVQSYYVGRYLCPMPSVYGDYVNLLQRE